MTTTYITQLWMTQKQIQENSFIKCLDIHNIHNKIAMGQFSRF